MSLTDLPSLCSARTRSNNACLERWLAILVRQRCSAPPCLSRGLLRNHRLALVVDVRGQQGASGGPGRAAELRLNGLAQVLQNMEAVGDLPRLRRAFMRALGERTAAIAADHLDVRMPLEPVRCRARRTIRQKIDHLSPLQVHDDGPISGALAPCPIIDTQALERSFRRGAPLLCRLSSAGSYHRWSACRSASSSVRLADRRACREMNQFRGSPGAARLRRGDLGQLLANVCRWQALLRHCQRWMRSFAVSLRLAPADHADGAHAGRDAK